MRPVALACVVAAVVSLASAGSALAAPAAPAPAAPAAPTTIFTPPPGGISVGPGLPAPARPPPGGDVEGGKKKSPGLFDIVGKIREAINGWFRGLADDALRPALKLVGQTLLSTPQLVGADRVRQLWQLVAGIADALLVLVVLAAGALVMTHETVQTRYGIKEILSRVFVAAILSNASLALAGQMIAVANALSTAFISDGADAVQASSRLAAWVVGAVTNGGIFLIFLGLACAALAVVLLVLYIVRAALIVLLVCAAPLMLLAHALPQTESLAKLWWRAMIAALSVQVAQALTLAVAIRVLFTPDGHGVLGLSATGGLIDLLVALCLLWVLLKIPFWAKEAAFSGRSSTVTQTVRTYITSRAWQAAAAA